MNLWIKIGMIFVLILMLMIPLFMVGGFLLILYLVIYLLLQVNDYTLLLGSILIFVVLAAVMIYTRRIDWYSIGEKKNE